LEKNASIIHFGLPYSSIYLHLSFNKPIKTIIRGNFKTQLIQQLFRALLFLAVHALVQFHNKTLVIPLGEGSSTNNKIPIFTKNTT